MRARGDARLLYDNFNSRTSYVVALASGVAGFWRPEAELSARSPEAGCPAFFWLLVPTRPGAISFWSQKKCQTCCDQKPLPCLFLASGHSTFDIFSVTRSQRRRSDAGTTRNLEPASGHCKAERPEALTRSQVHASGNGTSDQKPGPWPVASSTVQPKRAEPLTRSARIVVGFWSLAPTGTQARGTSSQKPKRQCQRFQKPSARRPEATSVLVQTASGPAHTAVWAAPEVVCPDARSRLYQGGRRAPWRASSGASFKSLLAIKIELQ